MEIQTLKIKHIYLYSDAGKLINSWKQLYFKRIII